MLWLALDIAQDIRPLNEVKDWMPATTGFPNGVTPLCTMLHVSPVVLT